MQIRKSRKYPGSWGFDQVVQQARIEYQVASRAEKSDFWVSSRPATDNNVGKKEENKQAKQFAICAPQI
jgi:hypothetical protein